MAVMSSIICSGVCSCRPSKRVSTRLLVPCKSLCRKGTAAASAHSHRCSHNRHGACSCLPISGWT
jgi:hypothetical protein